MELKEREKNTKMRKIFQLLLLQPLSSMSFMPKFKLAVINFDNMMENSERTVKNNFIVKDFGIDNNSNNSTSYTLHINTTNWYNLFFNVN